MEYSVFPTYISNELLCFTTSNKLHSMISLMMRHKKYILHLLGSIPIKKGKSHVTYYSSSVVSTNSTGLAFLKWFMMPGSLVFPFTSQQLRVEEKSDILALRTTKRREGWYVIFTWLRKMKINGIINCELQGVGNMGKVDWIHDRKVYGESIRTINDV